MKIKLNDIIIDAPQGASVKDVLEQANVATVGIAVAVNSVVVPASEYDIKILNDGDSVLIIKAFYGG